MLTLSILAAAILAKAKAHIAKAHHRMPRPRRLKIWKGVLPAHICGVLRRNVASAKMSSLAAGFQELLGNN